MSIYEEVEIEDMDWEEEERQYTYPCPCGDKFIITLVGRAWHPYDCRQRFAWRAVLGPRWPQRRAAPMQ